MRVSEMFPSKRLDAHDLRDFAGDDIVAVTIESIDYQTKNGKVGEPALDWLMTFAELKKPVKINAMAGYTIAEILGEEDSDDWPGKVIGLRAVLSESFGKPRWFVNPFDVGRRTPTLPPKTDLTGYRRWTTAKQQSLRAMLLPAGSIHDPASVAATASLTQPHAIGEEKAALIIVGLRERGLGWDDLVAHMKGKSLGSLIVGIAPGSCPGSIENHARAFLAAHPISRKFDDRQAEADKIVAGWRPPPAAAVTGEVINKTTGEVTSPTDGAGIPPDDDIPF